MSDDIYNKLQLLCLAQAQIDGYPDLAVLRRNLQIGWDCSSGTLKLRNSEHQGFLERTVRALKQRKRAGADETWPAPGARERSMGGELSRATFDPPETEDAVSAVKPDPSRTKPETDRQAELARLAKQGLPSQRFFPPDVDLAKAVWGVNRFLEFASEEEIEQILEDSRDKDSS